MVRANFKRFLTIFILVLPVIFSSCRKSDYLVQEQTITIRDNGGGTGTTTWYHNHYYVLEGLVFVNDGDMLTIEPGTVIRAKPGQGAAASALMTFRETLLARPRSIIET